MAHIQKIKKVGLLDELEKQGKFKVMNSKKDIAESKERNKRLVIFQKQSRKQNVSARNIIFI